MIGKIRFLLITALAVIAELIALLAGGFQDNIAAAIIPAVYVTVLFVWLGFYLDRKRSREKYRVEKHLSHAARVYDAKHYEQVTAADDGKPDEIQ